jgi:hypothetical protein
VLHGGSLAVRSACSAKHASALLRSFLACEKRTWCSLAATKLTVQVQTYVAVARAPQNHVAWQAPTVLLLFPLLDTLDADVAEDMRSMGAIPVLPPPANHAKLKSPETGANVAYGGNGAGGFAHCLDLPVPLPPKPTAVNLDATTLCALVSSVSNEDPRQERLVQWSQRNVHWQTCHAKVLVSALVDHRSQDCPCAGADSDFATVRAGGPMS